MVGGDSLEPADRNRLAVHTPTPAGGLARSIARPAEDAREDVRFSVEQVRLGVSSLSDEPDVLGDIRVSGAGPLAVDNLMVVLRIRDVRRGMTSGGRTHCWCGHFGVAPGRAVADGL